MSSSRGRGRPRPRLRQSSLFNLAGVVVVEDLKRDADLLRDASAEEEDRLAALRRMAKKRPSTKVIIDTGAGKALREASRGPACSLVTSEAGRVLRLWKAEVQKREDLRNRGPLEVACDLETTARREEAARRLEEAMAEGEEKNHDNEDRDTKAMQQVELAKRLEKEVFELSGHRMRSKYDWYLRKARDRLKADGEIRRRIADKEDQLTVRRFLSGLVEKK